MPRGEGTRAAGKGPGGEGRPPEHLPQGSASQGRLRNSQQPSLGPSPCHDGKHPGVSATALAQTH